jgi:hypothetical protein
MSDPQNVAVKWNRRKKGRLASSLEWAKGKAARERELAALAVFLCFP